MAEQAFGDPSELLIDGKSVPGRGETTREIRDPADAEVLVAAVREADLEQTRQACDAAQRAFPGWAATPAPDRARILFRFRALIEERFDDLARLIVRENGKLLSEAKGDVRRGLDVVEFACGIPSHLMGTNLQDVASLVDAYCVREPLGVCVGIPPFNFPAMIPLWTMPIAVACGNTFILKPAEKAPLTGSLLARLFNEAGLPPGVVSVIHGGAVSGGWVAMNSAVKAITFVGSTPVAQELYSQAALHGTRTQALGGGKNFLLVMPDADLAQSAPALVGSCFGCAGQRCLAGSVVVAIGDETRQERVVEAFVAGARELRLGQGFDERATMGPLHSARHKEKVAQTIELTAKAGVKLVLDGRGARVPEFPRGHWLGPTVFDRVPPNSMLASDEIFGPVVAVLRAKNLEEAIGFANMSRFGNSSSIFTNDGAAVRTFRAGIQCGMLGVNLGVPAPMAAFSFGGWKQSLFGDTHVYGPDAIHFYTRKKVVTERWFGATRPHEGWV
ncbi:MAG: CoA-acylating methylmalonate-semialdehyde dehydrogenase [Planctomycetota bacterium]|nr:CoA-acylating methylmalonate-semialdehyde dehydrogenase [Planctomycetota bacterium]